jgi:deaminated glutathione amidase
MSHFAIAGLQVNLHNGDNLERLSDAAADTMLRFPWVQMIMFSELALTGSKAQPQPLPGVLEDHCRKLARQLGVWLLPGSIYEKAGSGNYNTASVIAPSGDVVGRYRKMFPFMPYEKGISAGSNFLVFDVPDVGRFGVSICYDMWFPETSRTLAWMGAEVILHPTLTNTLDRDVELSIARATAATNQCYFVDINSTGPLAYGRSVVVGPEGDVIHQAGSGEEIIALELDLGRVRRTRERGLLGLGQPLKSFRDCEIEFPQYARRHESLALRHLGPLQKPGSRQS